MAITQSIPAGSRATKLTLDSVDGSAETTHWNITSTRGENFTLITTDSGSTSGNVLDGDLSFIDIWLPPSHSYSVRTRHGIGSGSVTNWTAFEEFTSRGPLNSYEKYLALSGTSGVDNVVTETD